MKLLVWSVPFGPCMTKRQAPPGRTSISCSVFVKPFGPHQCTTCCGSVHIRHTSSRGASNTRVAVISFVAAAALAAAMSFLLVLLFLFQLAEVVVEAVERLLPKLFVMLDPVGGLFERRRREVAAAPLRVAAAGDEAGALEHLQMLRDRWEAHVERRGDLRDRRLAGREVRQDRPPGRIGERRERIAELVVGHLTLWLIN